MNRRRFLALAGSTVAAPMLPPIAPAAPLDAPSLDNGHMADAFAYMVRAYSGTIKIRRPAGFVVIEPLPLFGGLPLPVEARSIEEAQDMLLRSGGLMQNPRQMGKSELAALYQRKQPACLP